MVSPTEDRLPKSDSGGGVVALELDFERRDHRRLGREMVAEAIAGEDFVWVDVDLAAAHDPRGLLERLAVLGSDGLDELIDGPAVASLARYEGHLLVVIPPANLPDQEHGPGRIALAIGEEFLLTVHRGAAATMLDAMRHAEDDFSRHARTPGFLLYEISAQVVEGHRAALRTIEGRLDGLQAELRGPADPIALAAVADVDMSLVRLRRTLLDVRDTLDELATRRSALVSESTQPFLAGQAVAIDRLANDALAAREIASSSLTLYLATTSARAGRALGRLTGITVIFLPMLFMVQLIRADLDWSSPWSALWLFAVAFAASVVCYMRRNRLL